MKIMRPLCLVGLVLGIGSVRAAEEEAGFRTGVFRIVPEVEVLAAYDDRVFSDEATGGAEGDIYTEAAAGGELYNSDAMVDVYAAGRYGYRMYDEYDDDLSDNFYDAAASVGSDRNPLKGDVSAYVVKSLDYDTTINTESGREPGSILTDRVSTRTSARGRIAYERNLSERTFVEPGYEARYYYQDFEDGDEAEWQEHSARLLLGYAYTERTAFTLSGVYTLQVNDDEDGTIGSVMLGARGRVTDKTRWEAEVGVSAADYESSGSEQGAVGRIRGTWQATEKISIYALGGNRFQPGYGGGSARMVYRLGYGAGWDPVERWSFRVQLLHDYQEGLGNGNPPPGSEEVRHFLTARAAYAVTTHLSVALSGRYIADEDPDDRSIVALSARYVF